MKETSDQVLSISVEALLDVIQEFILSHIIVNINTAIRLPELRSKAVRLYWFYYKTSILQKNNPIYATNSFCEKGLGWDKKTLQKYKKILIDEGFIEVVRRRNEDGTIKKTFIRVNYRYNRKTIEDTISKLFNSKFHLAENDAEINNNHIPKKRASGIQESEKRASGIQESEKRASGIQESEKRASITYNKNTSILVNKYTEKDLNTKDKNLHISSDSDKFLKEWNDQKIIVHKTLSPEAKKNLTRALSLISETDLIKSIQNYGKIVHDDKYFFDHKFTFSDFLKRGVTQTGIIDKKGFQMFLDSEKPFDRFAKQKKNTDPFVSLREEFYPITTNPEYDRNNLFDKHKNTYFGFPVNGEFRNPEIIRMDMDNLIAKNKELNFNDFCELELLIAHLFFFRSQNPQLETLQTYMDLWRKNVDRYRKDARKRAKRIF
jgi:hypothetical protein